MNTIFTNNLFIYLIPVRVLHIRNKMIRLSEQDNYYYCSEFKYAFAIAMYPVLCNSHTYFLFFWETFNVSISLNILKSYISYTCTYTRYNFQSLFVSTCSRYEFEGIIFLNKFINILFK